jgi:hypothetical protein
MSSRRSIRSYRRAIRHWRRPRARAARRVRVNPSPEFVFHIALRQSAIRDLLHGAGKAPAFAEIRGAGTKSPIPFRFRGKSMCGRSGRFPERPLTGNRLDCSEVSRFLRRRVHPPSGTGDVPDPRHRWWTSPGHSEERPFPIGSPLGVVAGWKALVFAEIRGAGTKSPISFRFRGNSMWRMERAISRAPLDRESARPLRRLLSDSFEVGFIPRRVLANFPIHVIVGGPRRAIRRSDLFRSAPRSESSPGGRSWCWRRFGARGRSPRFPFVSGETACGGWSGRFPERPFIGS